MALLLLALACALLLAEARYVPPSERAKAGAGAPAPKTLDELEKLAMEMKDVGKLSPQDFIRLLQHVNLKYDKRLEEIQTRLEGEMQRLSKHFEDMLTRMHDTEVNTEKNLEKIELAVMDKVQKVRDTAKESGGSWKWPFLILFAALLGVAAFFGRLYQKATKSSHYL